MKKKKEEVPEQYQMLDILKTSFYDVAGRTKLDRYKEFNNVFMGSDEGKRVLYEILGMAKLSSRLAPPAPHPIDKDRMLIHEGGRQLAADILDVISREPNMEKPERTNRKRT